MITDIHGITHVHYCWSWNVSKECDLPQEPDQRYRCCQFVKLKVLHDYPTCLESIGMCSSPFSYYIYFFPAGYLLSCLIQQTSCWNLHILVLCWWIVSESSISRFLEQTNRIHWCLPIGTCVTSEVSCEEWFTVQRIRIFHRWSGHIYHSIHYIRCVLSVKPLDILVKSSFIDVIDVTGVRSATAVNMLRLGNRFMMLNRGSKSAVAACWHKKDVYQDCNRVWSQWYCWWKKSCTSW